MASTFPEQLILFTRYPEAGRTKTRLIPVLGAEGAANLQRRMTEQLVREIRKFQRDRPVRFMIRFEGGDLPLMRAWLGETQPYLPQTGEDLGERLRQAFAAAFAEGARKAVIIGADCPALVASIMAEAFRLLEKNDLVLGPARDGGYYLVGLRAPLPELFTRIAWGTGSVFTKTLEKASQLHLSVGLLEQLADVDRPEDLRYFRHNPNP